MVTGQGELLPLNTVFPLIRIPFQFSASGKLPAWFHRILLNRSYALYRIFSGQGCKCKTLRKFSFSWCPPVQLRFKRVRFTSLQSGRGGQLRQTSRSVVENSVSRRERLLWSATMCRIDSLAISIYRKWPDALYVHTKPLSYLLERSSGSHITFDPGHKSRPFIHIYRTGFRRFWWVLVE